MNLEAITFKKLTGFYLPTASDKDSSESDGVDSSVAFNIELLKVGYVMTPELQGAFTRISVVQQKAFRDNVIEVIKNALGANRRWRPMYPNFPEDVELASADELWINAVIHYTSNGTLLPAIQKKLRTKFSEDFKLTELKLLGADDLLDLFHKMITTPDSISEWDREAISSLFDMIKENPEALAKVIPDEIPFKEIAAQIDALSLTSGYDTSLNFCKTATDVLRVLCFTSTGVAEINNKIKFKSLKKSQRRAVVNRLLTVANQEDLNRHRNVWIRAAHMLHPGDFGEDAYNLFKIIRNNEKIKTFSGKIEEYLRERDLPKSVKLLKSRPGEFTRRLQDVLEKFPANHDYILKAFQSVSDGVSSKVLISLCSHAKNMAVGNSRLAMGRSRTAEGSFLPQKETSGQPVWAEVEKITKRTLQARWNQASTEQGIKYVIEPEMANVPVPVKMRSTSNTLKTVSRGTRIPVDVENKNVLRLFIQWIGRDVDLSAGFYDGDMNQIAQISYTNLRQRDVNAYHSGDITNAPGPKGACEFVDIDLEALKSTDVRYVSFYVYSYSYEPFSNMEEIFAGWMMRSEPKSGEIFDARSVENTLDLKTIEARSSTPFFFDVQKQEIIWVDMVELRGSNHIGSGDQKKRD